MNNTKIAKQISEFIGAENITNATHCATRLRLQVKDPALVQTSALEAMAEVKKLIINGSSLQVVIGSEVADVYKEFTKLITVTEPVETENTLKSGSNPFNMFVITLSECLTPIIPALTAGGLISAFLTLFNSLGWITEGTMTYTILNFMGSAPLYFLPFFLAFSASKRLGTNRMLSMCIAAFLLYPDFVTLMAGTDPVSFLSLPVKAVTYTQSLIPILLAVWVQHYVENFLNKVIPNVIKVIFVPFLDYLIMCTLTLFIIGPVAGLLQDGITAIITPLSQNYNWVVCMILGGTYLILVGMGLHHGLLPLAVAGFTMNGCDTFMGPSMFCTVFALGGACLALAFRAKNPSLKQTAISTSVSTFLGITEPAIYGVAFINRRTLVSSMIGGAVGGLIAGIFGVATYGLAPAGVTSFALFGPEIIMGVVSIIVAFVIAFALSFFLGEDKKTN